jgi:NADH-ubiquinone oxidoreductase chain 1
MIIPVIIPALLTIIRALIAISFYTLLERKALGYFQLRKGPNKVGISGLPQPFADAIKLFTKERISPIYSNTIPFYIAPTIRLFLALLL